jgi:hypothetical protein
MDRPVAHALRQAFTEATEHARPTPTLEMDALVQGRRLVPGPSRPTVLIRCTLSAGSCERAGDEFMVEDHQQFSLDPRVG